VAVSYRKGFKCLEKVMFFKINKAMALRYPEGLASLDVPLPPKLRKIVNTGLVKAYGCIYLKAMARAQGFTKTRTKSGPIDFGIFQDRTGFECFVNKLHIEDYDYKNPVAVGVSFIREVSCLLRKYFPERKFRWIIGVQDYSDVILEGGYQPPGELICDVRFHTLRDGEIWLLDDLDGYNECVGVCDL